MASSQNRLWHARARRLGRLTICSASLILEVFDQRSSRAAARIVFCKQTAAWPFPQTSGLGRAVAADNTSPWPLPCGFCNPWKRGLCNPWQLTSLGILVTQTQRTRTSSFPSLPLHRPSPEQHYQTPPHQILASTQEEMISPETKLCTNPNPKLPRNLACTMAIRHHTQRQNHTFASGAPGRFQVPNPLVVTCEPV